jgi:hypothetical protein
MFSSEKVVESRGRRADDGRWYAQSTPYTLYVYSAFYDNRTSLRSPQIAVIAKFSSGRIDRCLLRFDNYPNGVPVSASKQSLIYADMLVVCQLPDRFNRTVPIDVALGWSNLSEASGSSWTSFRVPVEVSRRRSTRGQLALCLSAVFRGDAQPRQVVEWLEMQRLLGVELVVVYNRSMSDKVGEVFSRYASGQFDNSSDPFVEIRQSHDWVQDIGRKFGHQTAP